MTTIETQNPRPGSALSEMPDMTFQAITEAMNRCMTVMETLRPWRHGRDGMNWRHLSPQTKATIALLSEQMRTIDLTLTQLLELERDALGQQRGMLSNPKAITARLLRRNPDGTVLVVPLGAE